LNSQEKEFWKVRAATVNKEATSKVIIKKRKADDTNREKHNRIGKKRKGDRPVQAPSSYAVFCKENTQKILAINAKLNFSEISKVSQYHSLLAISSSSSSSIRVMLSHGKRLVMPRR